MCSKVFFLNPRRKGKSRRICICVPECPTKDVITVQDMTSYYLRDDVKLCRYDILVNDYIKQYGKDHKTSIDDVTCPDLPRHKGYTFTFSVTVCDHNRSACQLGFKTCVRYLILPHLHFLSLPCETRRRTINNYTLSVISRTFVMGACGKFCMEKSLVTLRQSWSNV